jgi:hypothetical protein
MTLRFVAVLAAALLFAGEGLCTTVCAPELEASSQAEALPPCHQSGDAAPGPEAPPEEHECGGPCGAALTAASPEPGGQAPAAPPPLVLSGPAAASLRASRLERPAAERRPPAPPRFLLHASFLI